jgi:hypothetical protein
MLEFVWAGGGRKGSGMPALELTDVRLAGSLLAALIRDTCSKVSATFWSMLKG